VLSTDPPVDRRDGDSTPKRLDRRNAHLRGDARSLETATSVRPYSRHLQHRRTLRAAQCHLRRI